MKELENLKELYLDEIKKINKKGELTPADGEAAKKALEAIEKINEICGSYDEMENGYSERYSQRMYPRRYMNDRPRSMMPDVRPYDYNYGYDNGGYSERRGRSSTTGRYISRNHEGTVDHMIHKLEDMRMDAPDNETRMAIDNVISRLEAY